MVFYSKKLSGPETKYSALDREPLAAYSSLRHFRFMLEGRDFIIFTDHKPLTHALFRVFYVLVHLSAGSSILPGRIQQLRGSRASSIPSQFNSKARIRTDKFLQSLQGCKNS